MSRKILSLGAVFVLVAMMSVQSGQAQDPRFKVHIPFDFSGGTSTAPAGDYTAAPAELHHNLWVIQNQQGSRSIMTLGFPQESTQATSPS